MKYLILYSFLLLCFTTAAQIERTVDTTYLSLQQILSKVEDAFPALKQYDERVKAIEQRAIGATAWMAPMFTVSPSNFAYDPSIWKEKSPMNQAGIMFSFTQTIPNPSRLRAQRDYYSSLTPIEKNSQAWTKNSLRTEAKLFYIQRLIAEKKLLILMESQELLNLIIKVAEEKYVYNQAELSVIYKAKSRLGDIANMRQMQHSVAQTAIIGLNTLMNLDIATAFRIDTITPPSLYQTQLETDTGAYRSRSDIQVIISTIESMRKDQSARAAMRKPDYTLGFTHSQMIGMPKSWGIMAGITIPIVPWVSRGWKSEVRMLDFEINAMQREKETMQLMAKQMISERIVMLKNEQKQYNTYHNTIIPELQKNMETALLQYRQTTGNLFVLLDAWEMLLMKKIEQQDKLGQVMQLQAQYEYEIEKR